MKDIAWELVEFTSGKGLEISSTDGKAFNHFIKVYTQSPADVVVPSLEKLELFAGNSLDFVVSADTLQLLDDIPGAIDEYMRVIKTNGYLLIIAPISDITRIDYAVKALKHCDIRVIKDVDTLKLYVIRKIDYEVEENFYTKPIPTKTCCIIRYGAFGDQMQASSVYAGLKKQGYHTTLISQRPGSDVVSNDPNLDKIIVLDRDQVPNNHLVAYWDYIAPQFTKFVNLCETVEGTFLAMEGRTAHPWPQAARHKIMNKNYVEFQHLVAQVPHDPQVKFYPTPEEEIWAKKTRESFGKVVVMYSLAGSSVHKTNAQLDQLIARAMVTYKDVDFLLVGGPECVVLEAGWENEPRVHRTSGKWSIRQSLTMLNHVDLIIGPETGVLNAAANLKTPKILYLSHSSIENLTRDWINTTSLFTSTQKLACSPCHMLHHSWKYCNRDEDTGTAKCQSLMDIERTWKAVTASLDAALRKSINK
jgi:ADP-heptose:LPS heptosyltransferase